MKKIKEESQSKKINDESQIKILENRLSTLIDQLQTFSNSNKELAIQV